MVRAIKHLRHNYNFLGNKNKAISDFECYSKTCVHHCDMAGLLAGLLVWPQIEFDRQGNGQGAAAGEGQQGPDGRVHFGQHNHPTF